MSYLDSNGVETLASTIKEEMLNTTFTGSTSSAAGSAGVVPAPAADSTERVLLSNGAWNDIGTVCNYTGSSGVIERKILPIFISGNTIYYSDQSITLPEIVRKKLWENASPSSSFGAQTITLSEDVENYLFWVIECYLSTTIQDKVVSFMCVGRNGHRLHFAGSGSNSNRGNSRDMEIDSTGKQLTFAANYYNNTSTNANLIPFKVFGFFHK